jgi:DNA-binding transcriptional LysR family regulator
VVSERLAAAVPFDHPLASRSRVNLATLATYPLITMPEGTGVRAVLDGACAAAGVRPDIALQASAPAAIADLTIGGLGVAILSASMVALHRDRLHQLTIGDAPLPAVLALVWKANHAPALQEFVRHSHRAFGTGTDGTKPSARTGPTRPITQSRRSATSAGG